MFWNDELSWALTPILDELSCAINFFFEKNKITNHFCNCIIFSIYLLNKLKSDSRKRPNYGGVRPQNPNQYPNKRPTKKPVTKKPVYTTRPPIYGGQGGGQNGAGNQNGNFGAGGQGSGFGDPHFMVSCPGQDPICFDYNPPAGSEMTLVMDPETG